MKLTTRFPVSIKQQLTNQTMPQRQTIKEKKKKHVLLKLNTETKLMTMYFKLLFILHKSKIEVFST